MVTTRENKKQKEKTVEELKKMLADQEEEMKSLVKELKDVKLNLAKVLGIKVNDLKKLDKKLDEITKKKPKISWQEKLILFNSIVKSLKTKESPLENERENYLLESYLLNHLAKESMKKYKKITAQSFSGVE